MRVVFDTSVLVSAIIRDGKSRKLLMKSVHRQYNIIISQEILQELREVLSRSKFKMTREEIDRVINNLTATCEIINIDSTFVIVNEDPDDNIIINTAFDAKAKYIVSGDKHLLNLKKFKQIKILSVNEMLKILG